MSFFVSFDLTFSKAFMQSSRHPMAAGLQEDEFPEPLTVRSSLLHLRDMLFTREI